MFETVELGQTLDDEAYAREVPLLRTELLQLQTALEGTRTPVIILLHGVEGGGRTEVLHLLHEWMDTRYLDTHAYGELDGQGRGRPEFYKYWMWLPPRGRVATFHGSWYTPPLIGHTTGEMSDASFDRAMLRIRDFERALTADGTLFFKFWFHIDKAEQKRRLERLASSKYTRWRVTKLARQNQELYEEYVRAGARAIRETSTGTAPWTLVEATDPKFRDVFVGREIVARLRAAIEVPPAPEPPNKPESAIPDQLTILDSLDLSRKLDKAVYAKKLALTQGKLNRRSRKLLPRKRSVLIVMEGQDAAGKGGAIRRLTRAIDPRQYRVIPIAAPTEEERAHHYLWRFWRHLPPHGRVTIYDRSWYGRVLVERVEGFAREAEWERAYKEINDFEEHLTDAGIVLIKFWLQISQDEQLRRFEARKEEPWKQHKITAEDYRNRQKTNQYEVAANEMIERTSTEHSPWTLVPAEDKRYARVKVLETVCSALKGLK